MTLGEMIIILQELKEEYGSDIRVLVNHSDAAIPDYIPAEDGCPAYISIESE